MNLWTELESRFKANATRPAITDNTGRSVDYSELLSSAKSVGAYIRANTSTRSRVCILNSHSYYDAIGVLGTLSADCTVVPMSLNYGEPNCCSIINRAEPSLLITDIDPLPESIAAKVLEKGVKVLSVLNLDGPSDFETVSELSDMAFIMFTSGTTGIPKGAMLSHNNILSNLKDIAAYFTLTEEDHFLIARPLYHGAVMTGEFLHAMMHGSRITFYSESFSPRRLLSFLAEKECTTMCATPTLFYHLAMNLRNVTLPFLSKVVVSGECLNPQVAKKLLEVFSSVRFFNVYGLTEASPRVSHLDPEFFMAKVGSVGIPLNSVEIKVTNDDGSVTPQGEIGELMVKGPNVMMGYWRDEELTATKISDGWLHSGDLAQLDEEGFIYILGRKDHMIIRAGVNIYPQDMENTIMKDESIKEVMVWGEPDPNYGQRICAAFVPAIDITLTTKDIMAICRQKLEPYKWPDEVLIVESLPRNASGKVMRGRPKN